MTQFDSREQAFEKKFAHDENVQFKVDARRNKLLGLWAAEHMNLEGEKATDYAKEVIKSDFEEAGDEDVYRKVKGDLDATGLDISEHRVRKAMQEFMDLARHQIMTEVD